MIVDPDFCDHWKTRMLVGSLNGDEAAPVYVLRLWAHCQNRRQSQFENLNAEALKALCRFPGNANKLEASLAASGFVRRVEDTLIVLNWDEYNRTLIAAWSNGRKGGRPKEETEADSEESKNPRVPERKPMGSRLDKNRLDKIRDDEDTPTPHKRSRAKRAANPTAANAGRRRQSEGNFDSRGSPADPDLPQQIFDAWNAVPGLDRVLELTEDRRSLIAERLREPTFAQSWAKSLQILAETPFAKGEGERGWLASFDWWLKPGTVVKILEGKYAPAKSRASGKSRASSGQPYVHREGDHKRLVIEAKRAAGLLPPENAEGM